MPFASSTTEARNLSRRGLSYSSGDSTTTRRHVVHTFATLPMSFTCAQRALHDYTLRCWQIPQASFRFDRWFAHYLRKVHKDQLQNIGVQCHCCRLWSVWRVLVFSLIAKWWRKMHCLCLPAFLRRLATSKCDPAALHARMRRAGSVWALMVRPLLPSSGRCSGCGTGHRCESASSYNTNEWSVGA